METWVEENTDSNKYINYKFTGKELDEETGLYYFGARYYDSKTSVFMSADPIYDGLATGGSIFAYCGNNPIMYTDPTGLAKDNGDGTKTIQEGDTLWEIYGEEWQSKSGYTGDPKKLQPGTIVGHKNETPSPSPQSPPAQSQSTPETSGGGDTNSGSAGRHSNNKRVDGGKVIVEMEKSLMTIPNPVGTTTPYINWGKETGKGNSGVKFTNSLPSDFQGGQILMFSWNGYSNGDMEASLGGLSTLIATGGINLSDPENIVIYFNIGTNPDLTKGFYNGAGVRYNYNRDKLDKALEVLAGFGFAVYFFSQNMPLIPVF